MYDCPIIPEWTSSVIQSPRGCRHHVCKHFHCVFSIYATRINYVSLKRIVSTGCISNFVIGQTLQYIPQSMLMVRALLYSGIEPFCPPRMCPTPNNISWLSWESTRADNAVTPIKVTYLLGYTIIINAVKVIRFLWMRQSQYGVKLINQAEHTAVVIGVICTNRSSVSQAEWPGSLQTLISYKPWSYNTARYTMSAATLSFRNEYCTCII